eukprot:428083-Pyramimonas_sp.AAC.1
MGCALCLQNLLRPAHGMDATRPVESASQSGAPPGNNFGLRLRSHSWRSWRARAAVTSSRG